MSQTRMLLLSKLMFLAMILGIVMTPSAVRGEAAGTFSAEVLLDGPEPRGHMMALDMSLDPRFTTLTLGGRETAGWVSDRMTDPTRGWIRSMRFKLHDQRFFDGRSPAVDIEIEYHMAAWGNVQVFIDTAEGVRVVGDTWGNTDGWRVARFRVDNARFRQGEKEGYGIGPFDIQVSGANGPLHLRRVRIVGYDPRENVNWRRLLKVQAVRSPMPGQLLAFTQGASEVTFDVRNVAFVPRPVDYNFDIFDGTGRRIHRADGHTTLPPGAVTPVTLPFDASAWRLGPYRARFQVVAGMDGVVLDKPIRLGVVSQRELPKARVGEFLYGLDPSNHRIFPPDTEAAFAYYRLMGVDLLRGLPIYQDHTDEAVARAVQHLRRENLRALINYEPPRPRSPEEPVDQAELSRRIEQMTRVIRSYGGAQLIPMLEFGNEPDLPFFWPGSIQQYVEAMEKMADAARAAREQAGLTSRDLMIMNGGLSFAGPTGDRRSREFLRLADLTKLDVIAYHAHGPGIEAERMAFERLQGALREAGKPAMVAVDTESGFSANTEAGLLEQARTVVEKMTYAQSVGSPAFIFFRLFMESPGTDEGGYGMTEGFVQPRPSVLSFRAMVERLRHHRFVRSLDAAGIAGAVGVNAFLFEEIDESARPTGRVTLVSFSERPAQHELAIRLASTEDAGAAAVYDLFGNRQPASRLDRGIALLTVGIDPVYLTWSNATSAGVEIIPPLASLDIADAPLVDSDGRVVVTVRNPTEQDATMTVQVAAEGALPMAIAPQSTNVTVAAGGQVEIPMQLTVGPSEAPLGLPRAWRVFPDADPTQLSGVGTGALPTELRGVDGSAVRGIDVWAPNNRIVFTDLVGGGPRERRPVLGMAYLDSPAEVVLPVAASSDWWMTWYVNGQQVFTTEPEGNRHGSLATHQFDMPLRKGRNLIAFRQGSGSHGWSIEWGGPRERQLATPGAAPLERISVTVTQAGRRMAEIVSPVRVGDAVPSQAVEVGTVSGWLELEPLAVLGGDSVENLFVAEPDSARWYHGEDDLSARIWVRDHRAAGRVEVAVLVNDDIHVVDGDQVHLLIANDSGAVLFNQRATGRRDEGARRTFYRINVPRQMLAAMPFRINVQVRDDDGFGLKQVMRIGDVDRPASGLRQRLGSAR